MLSLSLALSLLLPASPGQSLTSRHTADGLTLTISADCGTSRAPCPFRAEIWGSPGITRMVDRVDYTYVPDQRAAIPVRNRGGRFAFEGAQRPGELVYADVIVRQQPSGRLKTVALQAAVPFAAEVHPSLPPGLRFEDKYQMQYLDGGAKTDYYLFRLWLRGEPKALQRIRSVEYRLPEKYFSETTIRGRRDAEYFLDGSASGHEKWDIVAVIRWIDGSTSRHRIPFRPLQSKAE